MLKWAWESIELVLETVFRVGYEKMSVTKRMNFLKFVNEFKASVVWKTITKYWEGSLAVRA